MYYLYYRTCKNEIQNGLIIQTVNCWLNVLTYDKSAKMKFVSPRRKKINMKEEEHIRYFLKHDMVKSHIFIIRSLYLNQATLLLLCIVHLLYGTIFYERKTFYKRNIFYLFNSY